MGYSWASRRASSGSRLHENVGGSVAVASASGRESASVLNEGLLDIKLGREVDSSAALVIVRKNSTQGGPDCLGLMLPLGGLIETSLRAFHDSILKSDTQLICSCLV